MAFACVSPVARSYRWLKQSWKIESLPIFLWNKILCLNQRLPCIYLHAIVSFYFAARLLNSGDIFVTFPKCGICSELSFRALSPFLPHLKKKSHLLSLCVLAPCLWLRCGETASASASALLTLMFQMNMTLSLNLKPVLWNTAFFTRHNSVPQLVTKTWLQRELRLACGGWMRLFVPSCVQGRSLQAPFQKYNEGICCTGLWGQLCVRGQGGEDIQREGCSPQLSVTGALRLQPAWVLTRAVPGAYKGLQVPPAAVWWQPSLDWCWAGTVLPPPHPNARAFDGLCSDRLYELLGDDHTRWGRGQTALLSPLARWKERYYVESHTTAISEGDSQLLCKQKRALHTI